MNPNLIQILATALSGLGVLLGLPSSSMLLMWTIDAARHGVGLEMVHSRRLGGNPDAIILMLRGIREIVRGVESWTASLGAFYFEGIPFTALVGIAVGAVCWMIGRGLHADACWARSGALRPKIPSLEPA